GRELDSRRRSPIGERNGIRFGTNIFAQQRKVFAEIETRAQFANSVLPFENCFEGRGSEQPCGNRSLSGGGASCRDQFKKRTSPKDIEIIGIDVSRIAEVIAGGPLPQPFIVQAGQSVIVIAECALGERALADHSGMPSHECDEDGNSQHEPPCTDDAAGKGQPSQSGGGDSDNQAPVANEDEFSLQELLLTLPAFAARNILRKRSHPFTINRAAVVRAFRMK